MPTLTESLTTYLQIDRSPRTNALYTRVLAHLVGQIGPGRPVNRVTYEDLVDYLARHHPDLKTSSKNTYISVIKAFFHWCLDRGYVRTSPAAGLRRRRQHRDARSRAIPPAELRALVEYARVTSRRDYALLLFLADTGCRAGGLVSLTRANLHLDKFAAVLLEKGEKWHTVFYGEKTAAALQAWLDERPPADHDFIWTGLGPHYKPLTAAGVGSIIRRMARYTGASYTWGPHSIRHAVGHAYARAKLPATVTQHKLGHSSPSITIENYYPEGMDYVAQVSRRYALIALEEEEDQETFIPRVVPRTGS